jgi:membrane protease YdiL (CAAX protease family)
MSPYFVIGTIVMLALLYWGAYTSAREVRTIELSGNILLSIPEIIFKLVLLGLCLGIAVTLEPSVGRAENYLGWPPKSFLLEITIGAVVGLVLQFIVNILSTIAIRIWGSKIYSPVVVKSIIPRNLLEWILTPFPMLLAVSLEEVLFRALAVGGFSAIFPNQWWWIWSLALVSSLLFGLVHRPQGVLGMVLTALVGFAFCAIFIISGSLLLVIACHFVINMLQLIRAKEDLNWLERFKEKEWERRRQGAEVRGQGSGNSQKPPDNANENPLEELESAESEVRS